MTPLAVPTSATVVKGIVCTLADCRSTLTTLVLDTKSKSKDASLSSAVLFSLKLY